MRNVPILVQKKIGLHIWPICFKIGHENAWSRVSQNLGTPHTPKYFFLTKNILMCAQLTGFCLKVIFDDFSLGDISASSQNLAIFRQKGNYNAKWASRAISGGRRYPALVPAQSPSEMGPSGQIWQSLTSKRGFGHFQRNFAYLSPIRDCPV